MKAVQKELPVEPQPRPHAAKFYWMERNPGTAHWSVWEGHWGDDGPFAHRLTESTTYMMAKQEVWRRTINESVEVVQREGF